MSNKPKKDKAASGVTRRRGQNVVKSAGRSLEVLELFRDLRRPLRLSDISAALSLPASSATMLVRSLVSMGYLLRVDRTYAPTMRLALLGDWLTEAMFTRGHLRILIEEVRRKTGNTVILATRSGLNIEYLAVDVGRQPLPDCPQVGDVRPLTRTIMGQMILSGLEAEECERLAMRINAEERNAAQRVTYAALAPQLERIRAAGYGYTEATIPGSSVVAAMLPPGVFGDSLVLGCVGAIGHVRASRERIAAIMHESIAKFCRPQSSVASR